jgi:hypothetical protein
VAAKPKKKRENSNNPIPIECACPRKIRVAPTVLETGPVRCDVCGHAFLADGQTDPDTTPDPTGEHHDGMPTYPWGTAPTDLATLRQLSIAGLRPGGQPVAGRLIWRHGRRHANLYRRELAKPKFKRTPTDTQLAGLARANHVRHLQRLHTHGAARGEH